MTADEIAAMQADALAGTPGGWLVKHMRGHCMDYIVTDHPDFQQTPHGNYVAETGYAAGHVKQRFETDARRIARLPRLETAVTALTAELATERQARARYQDKCEGMAEQAEADQIKIEALVDDVERLRDALGEIANITERKETRYPDDWRAQIAACPECKRYADHPVQLGICDTHRKPIYAQEAHDGHETKILGYRAKDIARAALAVQP